MIAVGDPALDARTLAKLVADVEDRAFAASFVAGFRRLLPHRLGRITWALASADVTDALDAARSLKVAAGTVGALELAALALGVERHLRARDLPAAATLADQLALAGRRADRALASYVAAECA